MKRFLALIYLFAVMASAVGASAQPESDGVAQLKTSLYDYSVRDLADKETPLEQYRGKVSLVVNTASECGFTDQYKDLEEVYQRYKDRGFTVLGFPSNDFGGQEPGSNQEIKKFCEMKYRTTFPIFSKGHVSGPHKQEVYRFLTESSPDFEGDPGWNFVKFLVNREGKVVDRFSSMKSPSGGSVSEAIERELAK